MKSPMKSLCLGLALVAAAAVSASAQEVHNRSSRDQLVVTPAVRYYIGGRSN